MSEPLLHVNGVTHRYGESEWDLTVEGFSLSEGEVVGVLGPNGSGKSTLLRIAAGVLAPVSGSVTLRTGGPGTEDVYRMERREVARSVGYLPQSVASLFDYTAEEVVRMGRYPHLKGLGILEEHDVRAVDRAFHLTETRAFRGRRLSHLSGGERQRVFLASVLAQEPRLLLLDEPTSALDVHHQATFFSLLRELASGGMGVCAVTHDVNLASLYCARLVLLSEGRVVKEGTADEIIQETLLRSVYGEGLVIGNHPELDRPVVLPSAKLSSPPEPPPEAPGGDGARRREPGDNEPGHPVPKRVPALKRPAVALAVYGAAFLAAGVLCPFIGGSLFGGEGALPLSLSGEAPPAVLAKRAAEIIYSLRIPRVLTGLLVGGALAAVGAAFQAVLRNPLAEPFTLGVSGGAAVGAALAISVPGLQFAWGPFSPVQLLAILGAACALGLIYWIARRPSGLSMTTVLLAGVTVSVLSAGAIMLMRYLASPNLLVQMDRWMMGGVDVVGYGPVGSMMPLLLPGLGLLALRANALNHLSLGEEMAAGHGVDVRAVQIEVLVGGGLATAAAVSVAGPIAFVGLIVPHAVRRLSGYDHRVVLPASFLLGGAALVMCDTAARTVMFPTEIPVGVLTALIGGPLFIRLLVRSGR